MRTHYRFDHEWLVHTGADAVRTLLEDVAGYGAWWPGVRVIADVSTATRRAAKLEVRAPVGYRIRFTITESTVRITEAAVSTTDPTGITELHAAISGDLEGWCSWRVTGARAGTRVAFTQEVAARSRLLRLASPLLHRQLAAQHERLLRRAAAGMRRALEHPDSPA